MTENGNEKVEERQTITARKIAAIASKLLSLALSRLTALLSAEWGREVTVEEAVDFLEKNHQILSFDVIDEAIASDWKVKAAINTAVSLSGWVLRQHNGWQHELQERRGELLLEMARAYRPDVYEILRERKNITNFFADYILYKFRI